MKYTLRKNQFEKNGKKCTARPVGVRRRTMDHFFERSSGMVATLSDAEKQAVVDAYWTIIKDVIADGEEYHDQHISVRLTVGGVFEDELDRFDKDRHRVNLSAKVAPYIRNAAKGISMEYVTPTVEFPSVQYVFDWNTKTKNDIISSGGVLEIKGIHLKFVPDDEDQGVFFIHQDSGKETKSSYIHSYSSSKIQCLAPELTPGDYYMEVRNASGGSRELASNTDLITFTVVSD